ncbi:MAG: Maf family protein [Thermodesulfobacteriota bacterium]
MKNSLILASKSPRRYELLKRMGLEFKVIPSHVEEDIVPDESPQRRVLRLAKAKTLEIGKKYINQWILGADTIVYIDHSILGKPKDSEEAKRMLRRLSGREHRVFTGVSIRHLGKGKEDKAVVQSRVKIKRLTPSEIEWYIESGEPFDKAGGYAAQGIGAFMIESIKGSYTNVIGLPLCEVIQMLLRLDAITISKSGIHILD